MYLTHISVFFIFKAYLNIIYLYINSYLFIFCKLCNSKKKSQCVIQCLLLRKIEKSCCVIASLFLDVLFLVSTCNKPLKIFTFVDLFRGSTAWQSANSLFWDSSTHKSNHAQCNGLKLPTSRLESKQICLFFTYLVKYALHFQ